MRLRKLAQGMVLGLSLLLALNVFAATNKGSLQVFDNVMVNGQHLSPGEYSVRWDGSGPDVQVSIVKGSKVVMTTPARVVNTQDSPARDSAILKANSDGSKSLSEIRFGGKKFALAIGESGASGGMGSAQ